MRTNFKKKSYYLVHTYIKYCFFIEKSKESHIGSVDTQWRLHWYGLTAQRVLTAAQVRWQKGQVHFVARTSKQFRHKDRLTSNITCYCTLEGSEDIVVNVFRQWLIMIVQHVIHEEIVIKVLCPLIFRQIPFFVPRQDELRRVRVSNCPMTPESVSTVQHYSFHDWKNAKQSLRPSGYTVFASVMI